MNDRDVEGFSLQSLADEVVTPSCTEKLRGNFGAFIGFTALELFYQHLSKASAEKSP